jgi:PKD repeat protein
VSLPAVAYRLLLLTILLLAACSGGAELLLPGDGAPAHIEVVHGDSLSGRVGEPLGDSLVFQVTDSQRRPLEGVRIAFELTAAGPGADVVPDTAETDAAGHAYTRMVLGTKIGFQVGVARVVAAEGAQTPSTEFQVIALSENANGMAALLGDNQIGPVGSTLPQLLVVQVTDAFGNPISGVPIEWSVEGGGSVSLPSSVTDMEGKAGVQRTLGPTAGPQATLAISQGLAGSPVTFAHTATAGNASGLSLVSGNNQTGQVGTRLPADLVVRLVDEIGNGVPGTAVAWVEGTGGGSVTPENGITDEAGYASAQYTLGPAPGENRVDAVVSGVGVVNFTATATTAAPASLAIAVQPSGSARNGQPLARQPVIQVRDAAGGNAATPGIAVTAQLSGGGGELLGTRQRLTDGSGRATFTDLAIGGAEGTRVLVFTAPGFGGATSTPVEISAVATSTSITSDSPDPSTADAAVTVGFRVAANGVIPSGTVTVTDGVQSCTGTLSGGSGTCQLTLATVGLRTLRATYSGSAGLSGSSDTESHRVDAPSSGNEPPVASYSSQCDGLTCAFTDASTDRDGAVVGWSWNFGDGTTTTQREPTHTFPGPGRYTVTLTATDNDGASDQSTTIVAVEAPPAGNQPPTAAFSFDCDALRCSFDSDGSRDNDGRITTFSWEFGDGGTASDRNPRHDYAAAGSYSVTLRVTDDDGATGTVTHQVTASPPDNREPDADFEVSCTNLTCTFSDRSTDPDGTIVSRVWDYGDGSAPSSEPSHTYSTAGRYTVTLTVTDDRGGTDTREREARPTDPPPPNQAPTAAFTFSCNELTCSFNSGGSSDNDGRITSYEWNFEDGGSSQDPNPQHSYATGGTYSVTLTVTDDDGATDPETQAVTVTAPPPPRGETTTSIDSDNPDPSNPGQEITVTFSVTSSASGTPTGNVTVSDEVGGGCVASVASGSCSYTPDGTGSRTITATYEGDANFQGSSDTESHGVNEPQAVNR